MGMLLSQIRILTRTELHNFFGLNVLRFSRDKRVKRRAGLLTVVYIFLAVILAVYVGTLSYGLCLLSLEEVVPAYLITISSLLIFFFGIFKAGGMIFKKEGYDILSSLPVPQSAIVISRFLRMYLENLLFAFAVMVPGLAVYAWFVKPGGAFFLFGLWGILLVPALPVVGAILIGALITALASRMKYKSLVISGLSILAVLAIFLGSSRLSAMEGETSPEMLKGLSSVVFSVLEKVYPPAVWLGRAVADMDLGKILLCTAVFAGVCVAVIALIASCFHEICRNLYGTSAKHNYQMGNLKKDSVRKALVIREIKRYFSSGTYVTNTIIGPVMGTLFAGAVLVTGMDRVRELFPVPVDVGAYIPFVLAGIFCMMNTTCVSVSLEGKNWWIVNSLPLGTKSVLDAKLLMNLIVMLPFYLAAEVMLSIALRPAVLDQVWLLVIPAVMVLFSCVFGITVNLHFPVFTWESETSVVKQSAASMLGGMGGLLLTVAFIVVNVAVPVGNSALLKAVCCIAALLATAFLYRRNNRVNLQELL